MLKYWYKSCPVCGQGRLFVMKRRDDEVLFLLCEECESAWSAPDKVNDLSKNVSFEGIAFGYATEADIERANWLVYSMNKVDN